MRDGNRVLPGMNNLFHNLIDTHAVFDLGEEEGALAAHGARITVHHAQVRADCWRSVSPSITAWPREA